MRVSSATDLEIYKPHNLFLDVNNNIDIKKYLINPDIGLSSA